MRQALIALLGFLALLALASPASAAPNVTLSDVEDEVMCPTCGVALSMSESPQAQRQRVFIQRLIDRGATKDEVKARLVEELGPEVLAAPRPSGFSLAAYLVPLGALLAAVASLAVALRRRPRGAGAQAGERDVLSANPSFDELVDADIARPRP